MVTGHVQTFAHCVRWWQVVLTEAMRSEPVVEHVIHARFLLLQVCLVLGVGTSTAQATRRPRQQWVVVTNPLLLLLLLLLLTADAHSFTGTFLDSIVKFYDKTNNYVGIVCK
jgi:hypothetical protein